MNTLSRILATGALCAAFVPAGALAAHTSCHDDPKASGLETRMQQMKDQMDRIEWTTDRAEQRNLMELHMKKMHEGMRELRRREASEGCRLEMMHAMMEQMMRHQLVQQDPAGK
jgi:hypothetical protein